MTLPSIQYQDNCMNSGHAKDQPSIFKTVGVDWKQSLKMASTLYIYRQIDIDIQIDRQMNCQIDRQIYIYRQIDIQIDIYRDRQIYIEIDRCVGWKRWENVIDSCISA